MSNTIIGIDPGTTTGFAAFRDGKLFHLQSCSTLELLDMIRDAEDWAGIVFEDSRRTSFAFSARNARTSVAAQLKIARNIGMVDGFCALIEQAAADACIPILGLRPEDKGQKLDAARFTALTGWAAPSNQHQRDAAVVAWRYRNGWRT